MYRHLLVATDGSPLSEKAIDHAAALAKTIGAKLSTVYVTPTYSLPPYAGAEVYAPMSETAYNKMVAEEAGQILGTARERAEKAGVSCDSVHAAATLPWEAVLATAKERECDLIVMASHGRSGITALLLGSETQKVLTHASLPVLVIR